MPRLASGMAVSGPAAKMRGRGVRGLEAKVGGGGGGGGRRRGIGGTMAVLDELEEDDAVSEVEEPRSRATSERREATDRSLGIKSKGPSEEQDLRRRLRTEARGLFEVGGGRGGAAAVEAWPRRLTASPTLPSSPPTSAAPAWA